MAVREFHVSVSSGKLTVSVGLLGFQQEVNFSAHYLHRKVGVWAQDRSTGVLEKICARDSIVVHDLTHCLG